jgi:hypothetical protein
MTTVKKVKTVAAVFELPQRLGILQHIEYEPPPREWCTNDGCLYEGVLTAEGCRRGVCIKYRVWVHSRDRRRWEVKERWRRRRDEEAGGCIRQQVVDALWELAVEEMLRDYRREVERLREPPEPALVVRSDPVEELLKEWPELEVFGVEWVRKWLDLRERLIEIAKVMRKFPWIVDVVKQRPMSIFHPYVVEVYVARDGSDVCLSLTSSKAYCAQDGSVREVRLELEFKRYETHEEKIREVYRPKGLLAYATAAREYVRIL